MTNSRLPKHPTEDTPTNKKPTRDEPSVGAANTIIQDDQQLREAITEILDRTNGVFSYAAVHGYMWEGGSLVEPLLALFQKEQIQLVSELIQREKRVFKWPNGDDPELVEAVPVVVLERKKQELERDGNG